MAGFTALRFGSFGPAVSLLQEALNMIEIALAQLAVDGNYGPKTTARAREFQNQMSLAADGVFGSQSWQALQTLLNGAGYVIDVIGGIIAANLPPPKSWRDGLDLKEVALRDKLLSIAETEARANRGIRRQTDAIKAYMRASAIQPFVESPSSPTDTRVSMAGRSWCSDYVYWCLSRADAPLPAKANVNAPKGIYGSIARYTNKFDPTSDPKPGDLYLMPKTDPTKSALTNHIGIFAHWGDAENDPPGPTFVSYDGNSIDWSKGANSSLMQPVPDPPPFATDADGNVTNRRKPETYAVGSAYTAVNSRSWALMTKWGGEFLSISSVKGETPGEWVPPSKAGNRPPPRVRRR